MWKQQLYGIDTNPVVCCFYLLTFAYYNQIFMPKKTIDTFFLILIMISLFNGRRKEMGSIGVERTISRRHSLDRRILEKIMNDICYNLVMKY